MANKFTVGSSDMVPVFPIKGKPDFTITKVEFCHARGKGKSVNGLFEVAWQTASAGFGSMTVYLTKGGQLRCDNEAMGRMFLKSVLSKLVDDMDLDS